MTTHDHAPAVDALSERLAGTRDRPHHARRDQQRTDGRQDRAVRSGGAMGRLGRFVVQHRRAVILSWLGLLIITATIGSSAFSVLSTDFGAGTSTESGRVARRLDELAATGGQIAIVADDIDLDDPDVRRAMSAGLAPIAALGGVLPKRRYVAKPLPAPRDEAFSEFFAGSERAASTTMANTNWIPIGK